MKKSQTKNLLKRIAYLEFVQDQLSTELIYTDHLLKKVGFPQGVLSVKAIARDFIQDQNLD
ncbi:MAG: hypothetical protein HWD61_13515 [Parachlamydiaceae bacterium]|nr:MAG: hypothetical protein HWD61_13515 [Parachlamydiaceae bacterium]